MILCFTFTVDNILQRKEGVLFQNYLQMCLVVDGWHQHFLDTKGKSWKKRFCGYLSTKCGTSLFCLMMLAIFAVYYNETKAKSIDWSLEVIQRATKILREMPLIVL